MSVHSDIKAALAGLGYPVATNVYTGSAQTYFVITINTLPADFADDEPQHLRNLIMLHLYAPHELNTVTLRKQIATALVGADLPTPPNDASDEQPSTLFECEERWYGAHPFEGLMS